MGQVVYDPRQAISFPEKRPFFLEANENFQVPNALIYTRRIVATEAAAKVSGKVGGLNVGALSAVDDGEVGGGGTGSNPIYNLLRLRRDVRPQSNVGMVYTDRIEGGDYNRVLGADSRLLLGGRYIVTGQVASSSPPRASSEPTGSRSSTSPSPGRAANPAFNWSWKVSTPSSPRAAASCPGRESPTSTSPHSGWQATVYTWSESFKYPHYLYTSYFVERRNNAGEVTDTVPHTGTDRLTNVGLMLRLGTPQWQRFAASAEVLGGQDDNFDEWSSAWILYSTVEADWRPTDRVRVNGRFLEQRVYRRTDRSLVRLRTIPRLKLEYQVSRPIFVRLVGQYDGLEVAALRDDSRTGDPILIRTTDGFRRAIATERGGLRMDWLFSYQPNPGTVIFAGYGSSLGGDELFEPRELGRLQDGSFEKLSYLFSM